MFGSFGPWELILILGIALIVFGPGKLPDLGKSMGRAITEFRQASTEKKETAKEVAGVDSK